MFKLWMGILVLATVISFAGCDAILGGDDDDDNRVSLKGAEYLGTIEDTSGNLFEGEVIFDDDGNVSDVLLNGVSQGLTGEVAHEEGDIFSVALSDGEVGGFLAKGSYIGFVTASYDIGALQKNASGLASSYGMTDIAGSWDGYSVEVDASFEIEDRYGSEITINSDGTFDGSNNNGVEFHEYSALYLSDGTYGRFLGQSITSTGEYQSNVRAFLTPDKSFAAVGACYGGYPDECTWSAWVKD